MPIYKSLAAVDLRFLASVINERIAIWDGLTAKQKKSGDYIDPDQEVCVRVITREVLDPDDGDEWHERRLEVISGGGNDEDTGFCFTARVSDYQ